MAWTGQYILDDDGNPVPEPDLFKWARWIETPGSRIVARDKIGDVLISTVFLGLDYYFPREELHEPVLWETMIFGGEHDEFQQRYSSRAAALKGHQEALEMVKKADGDIEELRRLWAR